MAGWQSRHDFVRTVRARVARQVVVAQPAYQPVGIRGRCREMDCRGIGKDAPADVLDMHLPAERYAEVAHLPRPGQAARAGSAST